MFCWKKDIKENTFQGEMNITFDVWSADEIIQAYLDFVRKRNSKIVFIKYQNDEPGFKETMEGSLGIADPRIKSLPKKVQYGEGVHHLELFQKNWKDEFHLWVYKDAEDEGGKVCLSCDDSLRKPVYQHFKRFEPTETTGEDSKK